MFEDQNGRAPRPLFDLDSYPGESINLEVTQPRLLRRLRGCGTLEPV
ncbi:MAG: hypothetical protein ACRD44_07710 [Bryobacteraceae bacterium]